MQAAPETLVLTNVAHASILFLTELFQLPYTRLELISDVLQVGAPEEEREEEGAEGEEEEEM